MNLRGTCNRDEPEINFIPLIDVLLVILIFLMVTTTYQRVAESADHAAGGAGQRGEAAAEGDHRRRRRAGALRRGPDRVQFHDGRRLQPVAAALGGAMFLIRSSSSTRTPTRPTRR